MDGTSDLEKIESADGNQKNCDLRLTPAFHDSEFQVLKSLYPCFAGNWNLNVPTTRGMSTQELPNLKLPNAIICATAQDAAGVSISWRRAGQRMVVVGKDKRAGNINAVTGSQDFLQSREKRMKRVGGHHLAQNEVVAMETVVVDWRNGDDLRQPSIVPRQRNRAFPSGYQNYIAARSKRPESGSKQVYIRMADRHFLPIWQSRKAQQGERYHQPATP